MCVCADSVIFIKQSDSTNHLQRQLAHDHDPHNNNVDDVLTVVEYSLRTLVIYAVIYTAGTQTANQVVLVGIVRKVLELTCVAWGTCLVIISLLCFALL